MILKYIFKPCLVCVKNDKYQYSEDSECQEGRDNLYLIFWEYCAWMKTLTSGNIDLYL